MKLQSRLRILGIGLLTLAALSAWAQIEKDEPIINAPLRRLENWYNFRRFPFNEIPANAHYKAFLEAEALDRYVEGDLSAMLDPAWEFMGPSQTDANWSGRIHAIAINPLNTNIMYIGHAKGGVWKTTNGGTTWTNLTDSLASQVVGCLALDPLNPNIVYLGTGEEYFAGNTQAGVGIYRSTDAGATWTLLGNSTFNGQRINEINVNPTNTSNWVVSSDQGIWTTTNSGATFTKRLSGTASALVRDPSTPGTMYSALGYPFGGAPSNGVYKSTDSGVTWVLQSAGMATGAAAGRIELAISPSNPQTLYATISDPSSYLNDGVYRTTNGGTNWTLMGTPTSPYGQGWYDLCIAVDPTNANRIYVGDVNMSRSDNGGATYTGLNMGHTDMHSIVFTPGTATVWVGQDSGLYRSTNQGASWTTFNTGRGTMEFYELDNHPTDAGILAGGTQDNSSQARPSAGGPWTIEIGGDGFHMAFQRNNPSIVLGEVYYASVYRSTTGPTGSWTQVFTRGSDNAAWNSPIFNCPNTPARFYVGTTRVWRSMSSGASGSWTALSPNFGSTLSEIATGAATASIIYAGSNGGQIKVSTDDGVSWADRMTGLPTRAIGGFAVSSTNSNIAFVCFGGYGSGKVYKTTNAGVSWTNYSGNMPDTPCNGIVINPLNTSQVIVATDNGVFITDDGVTYRKLGILPNTPVTSIRANGTTGYLNVATYGRAMWRTPLPRFLTVGGTLNMDGMVPAAAARLLTFKFRDPGSSTVLFTRTASVNSSGAYTLTNIQNGTYDILISGAGYLDRKIANVAPLTANVTNANAALFRGNINNDGTIDLFDYLIFSNAYDTVPSDTAWNAAADLNGDLSVDFFDYLVLSANYEKDADI
ncbi:MAG: hypothetical protein JNM85_00025 [Chthonomonas sp.]|nr:hypothetical protein [Chthonomonas sp.]